MKRSKINEFLADEEDAIVLDGFDEAFLGTVTRYGAPNVACYCYEKCIQILMKDMSREDAEEYFDFNVIGGWMGYKTPYFLNRPIQ